MVWIDVIRMKWQNSVRGLLDVKDVNYRSLTGYPSQLFEGRPNRSPRSEQQEQELVWNLHPSTRKLHISFHSLLYNFYIHKDLALPLMELQERSTAINNGAAPSSRPSTYNAARQKPTLAAQVRHLKLSKILLFMDKLIVVQERMFRRLEKRTNLSEWVEDGLKRLFSVLETECETLVGISVQFSAAREDRYKMEQDINAIIDASARILTSFQDLIQTWTVVGNSMGANMATAEDEPWPDLDTVEEMRKGLPEKYMVDYDFILTVLQEAADEDIWLENGENRSGSEESNEVSQSSSGTYKQQHDLASENTVAAEVYSEEISSERDDQPILKMEPYSERKIVVASSKKCYITDMKL